MRNVMIGLATCLIVGGFGCTQHNEQVGCKDGMCTEMVDEPLRHVILCSFDPDTAIERIEAVEDAFDNLPGKVSGIQHAEWGTQTCSGPQSDGFSHCFVVSMLTQAERDSLLAHPAHREFMAMLSACAKRVMVFD